MDKTYYCALEIKNPSMNFIRKLNSNKYIIIRGETNSGKTTFSKALLKYFKNCVVFSFEKKNIMNINWIQIKKNVKNKNIFDFNSEQICDFISNENSILILKYIYNEDYSYYIFDFDEEKTLFQYLNSIQSIFELMKKYSQLSLDNFANKVSNLCSNFTNIYIFSFYSNFKSYIQSDNCFHKNNLYVVLKEKGNKFYFLKNNQKENNDILENLIIIKYINNFSIIDKIVNLLNFNI